MFDFENRKNMGNIHVYPNRFEKAGEKCPGHTHNFDHAMLFLRGEFQGEMKLPSGQIIHRKFIAPDYCLVKSDVEHEITALTDDALFWCVFSHRDPQGNIIDEYSGNMSAYV